jgi:hypothetical protein
MRKKKEITSQQRSKADAEIRLLQKQVDYDLKDFTIELIVQKFEKDEFWIPDYQREYVWRESNKALFIESVLLGLPIPFMFMAENDDGRLEIVDGAQRIQTLEAFLAGDLTLNHLEKLPSVNGFTFSDLPDTQQRKFVNRALRIIILDENTDQSVRHELFKRINTSGQRVRPSEIRIGSYPGPFMDFLRACAELPAFLELCPISTSMMDRQENVELVTRFFCYLEHYRDFKHDVEQFLNQYILAVKDNFDQGRMEEEFTAMLDYVRKTFPAGFAKTKHAKTTPRVRFEAIAVGVGLALRQVPMLKPVPVTWLETKDFLAHTTTHASNSGPRLRGRIEYVRDHLLSAQ